MMEAKEEEDGGVNHNSVGDAVRHNNILWFFKSGGCGRSTTRQQFRERRFLPTSATTRDRKDSWPACVELKQEGVPLNSFNGASCVQFCLVSDLLIVKVKVEGFNLQENAK